jgi:hypothetical protein
MGLKALTQSDDGKSVIPSSEGDWQEWISATSTRNYLLQDPLLDWLDLYGHSKAFQRDDELAGYDPRTDFSKFLLRKGGEFETAVLKYLKTLTTVATIASNPNDARDLKKAEETFAAMKHGEPVISHGVLRDAAGQTYGIPDILIRSDELARLFPNTLTEDEARQSARDLGEVSWHYRIIDIKFTTLDLLAGGDLGNSGSAPAYKTELFIYNRALGRIQGYLSPVSYLLGRSWKQELKGKTYRGDSCMERLAPVPQNSTLSNKSQLIVVMEAAANWIRQVRLNGKNWSVLPDPSVPELRPNMGNDQDAPWSSAKHRIAQELEDLTLLWQVGPDKRTEANRLGIYRWRDPKCTATALGVTGPKTQPALQAILDINQPDEGPRVAPSRITTDEQEWRNESPLEFYVDFETVNDLNDDFSKIPKRGGLAMIFMIGCGHLEQGSWQFQCFTAEDLTERSELIIIDAWLAHMKAVRDRLGLTKTEPLVFHWSPAETSNWETAYNAARTRHQDRAKDWPSIRWFDIWKQVIRAEPVVARGALGFGLKAMAQAMQGHGLIETQWKEGPVDGRGATAGAWWCAEQATLKKASLLDIDLMQDIQRYNEVDCKVMMEILRYLRKCH